VVVLVVFRTVCGSTGYPRTIGGSTGCSQDCVVGVLVETWNVGGSNGCSEDCVLEVLVEPKTVGGSTD